MKIFSPHRQRMEAKRRFGSREFQNKIKHAQSYKRIIDPRTRGFVKNLLRKLHLDSKLAQLSLIAATVLVGYYLFISPYFIVTNINVSGTEQLSAEQVKETISSADSRWLLIPQKHLILLSHSYVSKIVTNSLPLVKEIVDYKRVWPNTIEFSVVERKPGFAFTVDGKNYLVDEEGVVVRELDGMEGLIQVYDQVSEPIQVTETLSNVKLVAFIISSINQWPNKLNSEIKEIKVPGKAATQLQIISSEGWGVFFDVDSPVEAQLSNLALILSKQIPPQNRLKLAYIDLRFDKWAYYCYKDSPCQAQPQATDPESAEADPQAAKIPVE